MQGDTIVNIDVSTEMQNSFLEYAYSVIYARALPDARDGLKPVQRRILFTMSKMGLEPTRAHVKSSRVAGEVMGKYHPHGDSAIYDAIVRLAQDFNMRLPLADGHGNFGSLDGGPAASRYTEVRMAPGALDMVRDIDEDTVEMVPNYDSTLMQPEVLPAAYPNLLVNGAAGIAVGMATKMPPHNLREVVAAGIHLLDHPAATTSELMRYVPGPDLPGGGTIVGLDGIKKAYETGVGKFVTRAKYSIEQVSARRRGIVFTELPYLVGPEKVIEKIKDGVKNGKLAGIADVSDLTDRKRGLRLVVEVKAGYNPEAVLAGLFRHTPLEESFGINSVALVDGQPQTLSLKRILEVFVDHRLEVTLRRSKHRRNKAKDRLHLVEGLLIAVLDIDDVISIIRQSEDATEARTRLMTAFDLTEIQAEHILALQLRRLTKFSRIELETERDELVKKIAELTQIIEDENTLHALVRSELREVSRRLGDDRRTTLVAEEGMNAISADTAVPLEIPDEPTCLILSAEQTLLRIPGAEPLSRSGPRVRHDAMVTSLLTTSRSEVGVVTSMGRMLRLRVLEIPAIARSESAPPLEGGTAANQLLELHEDEIIVGLARLEKDVLGIITQNGTIKRVRPEYPPNKDEWIVITLAAGDKVIYAGHASDNSEAIFIAANAQLLRTDASKIRPQGVLGQGIAGMNVSDSQVIAGAFTGPNAYITTVAASSKALPGTGQSSIKISPLDVFPPKGRGGQGVRAHRFLKGEDILEMAAITTSLPRATTLHGEVIELPEVDSRRDGSGQELAEQVGFIG
ncbi:MAG: DNA topoisomerase IV subunit A [Actinomycetaceae bacterium]|nr:DNA topoisomerase IV subunit A [Actinomycetaceae bacterium]